MSPLGAILGPLGASWALLGPSWGLLGPSWGHLGAILGPLWSILGPSWGILGPTWAQLGPSLGPLGAILGPSWGHGWLLGAVWGPLWNSTDIKTTPAKTFEKIYVFVNVCSACLLVHQAFEGSSWLSWVVLGMLGIILGILVPGWGSESMSGPRLGESTCALGASRPRA